MGLVVQNPERRRILCWPLQSWDRSMSQKCKGSPGFGNLPHPSALLFGLNLQPHHKQSPGQKILFFSQKQWQLPQTRTTFVAVLWVEQRLRPPGPATSRSTMKTTRILIAVNPTRIRALRKMRTSRMKEYLRVLPPVIDNR